MDRYIILLFIILIFSCKNGENKHSLSKTNAKILKQELYNKYSMKIKAERSHEIEEQQIIIDNIELKYDIKFFGKKPVNGWSLYFSLHGGGGVTDEYNENQWNRHKELYELEEGILLTPRSPTNTWNMWHQAHIDILLNRLIQNMIMINDVDPNRVYLVGYSAGGDGVYQLAPRMADRFAAAAMMAGHPNDASPLGLRNIGFTVHMGGNDSAYNRNKVAIEWGKMLNDLKTNDPDGYMHQVKIYKGKGHHISHAKNKNISKKQIDNLDSSGISWISKFTRNPYPKRVVWKQDDVTHKRFYWLHANQPQQNSLIIANIDNQIITIEKSTLSSIVIRLNDNLVDMDKKVIVRYLGNEIFNGIVNRNKKTISNSIQENGDLEGIYFGEISVLLKIFK